ncbi:hypothetical protein H6G21_21600 [Alkalinema sp. FACHB-956]|nr:hypothetical protein [Alkalinema sp. FACHB-956]
MDQNTYPNATDLGAESYLVVGLATCFLREDGEVHPVQVIEPIPAAAMEALIKGIPTSYEQAIGITLGSVLTPEGPQLPAEFPAIAQFCDDFAYRATATARTYQARPQAQELVPLGTTRKDFNYSTERKRILNSTNIVRTEDNVKQHAYTHQVL